MTRSKKSSRKAAMLITWAEPCALSGRKLLCDELGQDRLVRGDGLWCQGMQGCRDAYVHAQGDLRVLRSAMLHLLFGARTD